MTDGDLLVCGCCACPAKVERGGVIVFPSGRIISILDPWPGEEDHGDR